MVESSDEAINAQIWYRNANVHGVTSLSIHFASTARSRKSRPRDSQNSSQRKFIPFSVSRSDRSEIHRLGQYARHVPSGPIDLFTSDNARRQSISVPAYSKKQAVENHDLQKYATTTVTLVGPYELLAQVEPARLPRGRRQRWQWNGRPRSRAEMSSVTIAEDTSLLLWVLNGYEPSARDSFS